MQLHTGNWRYLIGFGSIAAVFSMFIYGCSMNVASIEPESLYQDTLKQLSEEDHVVQREDLGSVISQQSIDMNWNPMKDIERFQGATNVKVDQKQSNGQYVVLLTPLDQSLSKQLLLEQLHDRMEAIRIEDSYIEHTGDHSISRIDKANMDKEIKAYIDDADRQLNNRLQSADVHSTMLLWIDRSTKKPIRIQFHTTINGIDEQMGKETIVDSYLIT